MKKTLLVASLCVAMAGVTGCGKNDSKDNKDNNKNEQKKNEQKKDEAPKAGDACDTKGEYACNGDVLLVCKTKSNKLIFQEFDDCSNYSLQCKTNKASGEAWCVKPCTQGDNTRIDCDVDEDEEKVFSYTMACEENNDGSFSWWEDVSKEEECKDYICHVGVGCDKIYADEGKKCDSTFVEKCEGNVVVYCNSYNEITANSCGLDGDFGMESTCKIIKDKNFADCALSCSKEGDVSGTCYSKEETRELYSEYYEQEFTADMLDFALFMDVFECMKTQDGSLGAFYAIEELHVSECTESSYTITDADKGVNLKENDKCNADLFVERCSGEKKLTCDFASKTATYATVLAEEDCTCVTYNNKPQCALEACTTGDADKYACDNSLALYGIILSSHYKCVVGSNTTNAYYIETNYDMCSDECITNEADTKFGQCKTILASY